MTDQNSQLSHDTIAAAIELAAVTQLKSLLGLPEAFSGSLVSGATMANFAGLAIGRQWLGQQHSVDVAQRGLAALGPIRVLAANPHASSVKALSMLGIGRDALTTVASLPESEAMDMAALERQLAAGEAAPRWCWPAPARSTPSLSTICRVCWRCGSVIRFGCMSMRPSGRGGLFAAVCTATCRLATGGLHHRRCAQMAERAL